MRRRSLLYLFLALVAVSPVRARWDDPEAGLPVVTTHAVGHLGVAENYVIIEDARGRLYAANDQVLEYDGDRWSAIQIGRGSSVRGLAVDDSNRIWCGAVNELGFIDEDATGARAFHSLRAFLPEGIASFAVRGAHRQGGQTLFVCADTLLIWDGSRLDHHPMPTTSRLLSFDFEGAAYISQRETGLWRWDGASLAGVELGGVERGAVFGAWRDADGHPVFMAADCLVRVRPTDTTPFAHETMREIQPHRVMSVVQLPDRAVAVSTFTGGIFFLGEDGRILRRLDRRDGLPGLNCSRASRDRHGRVWVGTTNSVFSIAEKSVQTRFNADNGNGGDAVHVVHSRETGTLSATMEAIRRLAPGDRNAASFQQIPFLESFFMELAPLADGTIIAAGSQQLLRVAGDHTDILLQSDSTFFQFVQLDPTQPRLAIGEGDRISFLDLGRDDPRLGSIGGFPEAPTRLNVDAHNVLWASFRRNGVIGIREADQPDSTQRQFAPGKELPAPFHDPAVFVLGGDAYAFASNAILALPGTLDGPAQLLLNGIGLLSVERRGTDGVWAVATKAGREPRLVRITKHAQHGLEVHVTDQSIRDIANITVFSRTEDHILWVGGSDGTIRIDAREVGDEPPPQAPMLQAVNWRAGEQVTWLSLASGPTVDFARTGTIEFHLRDSGDPFAGTQLIETRLVGTDKGWRLTGKTRAIAGLDEGRHTFEARVVGFLGNPGPVVSYTFTITPPWFRTPLAYLAYIVAFGGSLVGAAQWRTRRIRHQNAQLEQIVNRRTEELAQAVSARSAFLANMGHEIRNPLNGVVGLVGTLRSRELAPEQKDIVDRIGACADQLISVIEDVLEYARVDAGRIALRTRNFVVREPVEASIDIFRAAQPGAVITLEAEAPDLGAHVSGDPDRIRHILVNYLANALKFGAGTPVTVGVRREGALLVFSVRDRGPGLTAEEQARLFVRFSRGSLAYKNAIPGTGLGLAACKAYAEAMGGDVSVESEPGHGATFFLRIPHHPATAGAVAPVPTSPDVLVGRRALVVDDQDFNRFVLTELLGRMGATTVQASSIEEAREAFRARVPDIVFVDFDLAGATGADLADWIRKEAPAGRDVPIIATTAFEVDEVRRRCEEAAMDGFLSKPVTAQRLAEVVAHVEAVRSGGPSPITPPSPPAQPTTSSFLDILAGGDPVRRKELERSTWSEVLTEALAAHRALRRDDAPITARHAHRLVSAALILGHREIVTSARELNGLAKAGDLAGSREVAARLRRHIRAARKAARE